MEAQNPTYETIEFEIRQGSYWRSTKKWDWVPKGTLLLIKSLKIVDDRIHTVILQPHPDTFAKLARQRSTPCDYLLLTEEFLRCFEPVPDAEAQAIRNKELGVVQAKLQSLQDGMMRAQANPSVLAELIAPEMAAWAESKGLPADVTLPLVNPSQLALGDGLTKERLDRVALGMEQQSHKFSLISKWTVSQVDEIRLAVEHMTPYATERAVAATASMENMTSYVTSMLNGAESLKLYILEGVLVTDIKRGESAPANLPLTIRQRKLYLDEELLVWHDFDAEFSYHDLPKFRELLAVTPGLVEQMFPSERSIICVATTDQVSQREINGLADAFKAVEEHIRNRKTFLLVRDGENIYQVNSPIETHENSQRLFPSKAEIDALYADRGSWNSKLQEYEKQEITYRDVQYGFRREQHDERGLHYKRFLILLAGLDRQRKLFGEFHDMGESLAFISPEFQQQFMSFLHDDEYNSMQLPGKAWPNYRDFIKEKNKALRPGSRVACDWKDLINPNTAPTRCQENSRTCNYWCKDDILTPYEVVTSFRQGDDVMAKTMVSRSGRRSGANISLTLEMNSGFYNGPSFLVLDAVTPEELRFYIHNRTERRNYLGYLRLFKAALRDFEDAAKRETEVREMLLKFLGSGSDHPERPTDIEMKVDRAIRVWKYSHPNGDLGPGTSKKVFRELCALADASEEGVDSYVDNVAVAQRIQAEGIQPLRLSRTGDGYLMLYYVDPDPDNRIAPQAEVMCVSLPDEWNKLPEIREHRLLQSNPLGEIPMCDWEAAKDYCDRPAIITRKRKQEMLLAVQEGYNGGKLLLKDKLTPLEWDEVFRLWKAVRQSLYGAQKGRVTEPDGAIPVGLSISEKHKRVLYVGFNEENAIAYLAPTEELRKKFMKEVMGRYRDPSHVAERFAGYTRRPTFRLRVTKASTNFVAGLSSSYKPYGLDWNRLSTPRESKATTLKGVLKEIGKLHSGKIHYYIEPAILKVLEDLNVRPD